MRLSLAAIALIASPALAQVSYTSQARSVHAWSTGLAFGGPNLTITAPDFAPFVQTASSVSSDCSATAYQSSSLEPGGIFAQFSTQGSEHSGFQGIASAALDVTFQVSAATPWSLTGSYNQLSSVLLTTQAGSTIFSAPMGSAGALSTGGVFDPGLYRLRVTCQPEPGPSTLSAVSVSLAVPGPGPIALLAMLGLSARRPRRA